MSLATAAAAEEDGAVEGSPVAAPRSDEEISAQRRCLFVWGGVGWVVKGAVTVMVRKRRRKCFFFFSRREGAKKR